MKMKKSKGGILVPDKRIVVNKENPFDYLLSLKENGRTPVHNDIEHMGKSAASMLTSMDVDSEINIAKTIRELMASKVVIPKDMKIDDSDLPTAANFYEWVTQDRFGTIGDERPFLEQLLWGIVAFNDYCPRCTDMEWMLEKHKVDDTYSKFERKVCVLEHGVCPSCGLGRSQAVAKGLMPYYNELAINAGQRCVVGETPIISAHGLLHIDEMFPDAPLGFTEFMEPVHNGQEFETTSHYFVAEPEMVYRVDTARGFSVTGTSDHPIDTEHGFVKIGELELETELEIHYGQRVFGQGVLANPRKTGENFFNTVLPLTVRTAREQDQIAFLQGLFREARRILVGTSALRDVSALLLNAGYPHTIDGPCIQLDSATFQNLQQDNWSQGTFTDRIKSVSEAGILPTYDFTLPKTHQFITGGILSHNSGKSHTVGTYLAPYHLHRLLKLQKPAQFYGLSRTTMLQGTFAALTYTQAKDTLWTPFYGALVEGQWFKQYFGMLKHYENVYGEKLFKLTDTFVDFRVRGLQYHPMGPDKRVMRGRTRVFISIDEIAYFDADKDSNKVKISAYEVYDALVNSLFTVRGAADALLNRGFDDVLSAYAMNVSSPTSKNDMIHELLNRAKEGSSIYGIHRPTWMVNPNFKRTSKIIVEAYKKDPVSAEKNFGANPPMIANPFLANHKFIMNCEGEARNALKLTTQFKNSKKLGQSFMYATVEKCKKSGRASILAIDAGEKDNSFSIAGGHVDENFNLVVDLIGEIIPLPGFRINHSLVYSEVILPIMQRRNVKVLLADRWNSLKLLDDAALDMGDPEADDGMPSFISKQHSLKYVDMVGVRTRMEQGQIILPRSELKVSSLLDALDSNYREFYADKPIAHLFKQMFTIKDLEKGVGKGDGYTDDNWRAMALLLWGLMEEEFVGMLMHEPLNPTLARPNALGASKLGGGGGTSVGTGGGGVTTHNGAPLMIMSGGRSR
uniref:Terminase large subunit n=1 Tax=Pseudomonas phage HRDY3 TaxID=3236930 RepID=A0AB39CE02_9VIRU